MGIFEACQLTRWLDTAFDVLGAEFREGDYETKMKIERSVVCNKPQWAVRRKFLGTFEGRCWSVVLLKSATPSCVSRHKGWFLNTDSIGEGKLMYS